MPLGKTSIEAKNVAPEAVTALSIKEVEPEGMEGKGLGRKGAEVRLD